MGRDTHYDLYKKDKSSSLKRFRRFVEYIVLITAKSIASLFPIRGNQKFGAAFGRFAMKLATKDRGIAEYQLGFCFPEKTEEERKTLLVNSFRQAGTALFETLVIQKFKTDPWKWIKFENEQVLHDSLNEGNGAILLFAHVGNWELYPTIFEMLNIKGMAISAAVGDSKLDRLLDLTRSSSNLRTIHRGDKKSAREMLHCFRNNEIFVFGMDQDTRVKTIFVDFFGRKAATAIGAATFAQRFNAPVISGFGARLENGSHLYSFEILSQKPYRGTDEEIEQLTERYNLALEKHIRKYPDQWVWFHRRWKNQPD
ncbi:hypothetical protein KJ966_18575 [bacterium]|nr:hypothetical protein [bacterium]